MKVAWRTTEEQSNDIACTSRALRYMVLGQEAHQAISCVVQTFSTCTHLPLHAIKAYINCHLDITLIHQNPRVLLSCNGFGFTQICIKR